MTIANTAVRHTIIDNLQVGITDVFADVLVMPFGHVIIDAEEKTLRPITQHCAARLMQSMYVAPLATAEMLERVERIADLVYPNACGNVDWLWELPAEVHICERCSN